MDPTLYASFYSYGQLLCLAGGLGLLTCYPHYTLRHKVPPSFTNPNRPDPWLLVQGDHPAAYHLLVGGPWGPPVT